MKKFLLVLSFLSVFVIAACRGDNDEYLNAELSSNITGIDVSITPSDFTIGDDVTLSAPAHEMYRFSHWENVETGAVVSTEQTYTFTATGPLNIIAMYVGAKEAMAAETLAQFSGDLSHLDDLMASMNASDALTIEIGLLIETFFDQDLHEIDVQLTMRTATDNQYQILEYDVILSGTDMPFDDIRFHFVIKETTNFFEMFIDLGFIFDLLEMEEDLDFRTLLAFDNDYLHLYVPQHLRDDLSVVIENALDELLDDMVQPGFEFDETMIDVVFEKVEALGAFLSMAYLNDLEGVDVEASIHNETDILTKVTLTSTAMQSFFTDIFEPVYDIAVYLNEDQMLPSYETFVESESFQEVLTMISDMEALQLSFLHTPFDGDRLVVEFHVLPFLKQFDDGDLDDVQTLNLTLDVSRGASLSDTSQAKNIYHIIEEMMMVMMAEETYDLLLDLEALSLDDGMYSLQALEENYGVFRPALSMFIDVEHTSVVVSNQTITVDFVYTTNDLSVYNGTVSLSDFLSLNIDAPSFPEDRGDLTDIYALFDRSHLNIYKLMVDLLETILEEGLVAADEFPNDEWMVNVFGHIDTIPYIQAYHAMTHALDIPDVVQERHYVARDSVHAIYNQLLSDVLAEGYWEVDEAYEIGPDKAVIYLSTDLQDATIVIETSLSYRNASNIIIEVYGLASADIPNEDVVNQPDIANLPRYPDSVLLHFYEDDGISIRTYIIEKTPDLNIFSYYYDYITNGPHWQLDTYGVDRDHLWGFLTFDDGEQYIEIEFYESYDYPGAMEISIIIFD